jgi:hypothetical protein
MACDEGSEHGSAPGTGPGHGTKARRRLEPGGPVAGRRAPGRDESVPGEREPDRAESVPVTAPALPAVPVPYAPAPRSASRSPDGTASFEVAARGGAHTLTRRDEREETDELFPAALKILVAGGFGAGWARSASWTPSRGPGGGRGWSGSKGLPVSWSSRSTVGRTAPSEPAAPHGAQPHLPSRTGSRQSCSDSGAGGLGAAGVVRAYGESGRSLTRGA